MKAMLKIAKCYNVGEAAHWIAAHGPALVVMADDGSGHICYHCIAPYGDGELLGYYGLTHGISVEQLHGILATDAGQIGARTCQRHRKERTPAHERRMNRIMSLYYEEGMTQQEIADVVGLSRVRVSQIISEAKAEVAHGEAQG